MTVNDPIIIRPATGDDVDAIFGLLEIYTANGIVLKRSKENINSYLANFAQKTRGFF